MDGLMLAERMRGDKRFGRIPRILLSSAAARTHAITAAESGFAACLLKPVRESQLGNALAIAMGATGAARSDPAAAAPRASSPQRGLILLAEDNPVNQKFAVRVLEGAGHQVTVAANGREAIEHTAASQFDVVLMDVQMPEVDGLDATRAIRARDAGRPRLPIIAMTANAMQGDREMCLESGMDGYVPKPVKRDVLFAEIDRVLKEASRGNIQ